MLPRLSLGTLIQSAVPSKPPSLNTKPGNLYQVLSRKPNVNNRVVHQVRWGAKGIENCWWTVTRASLKCEGNHGKAWGVKWWRGASYSSLCRRVLTLAGKRVSDKPELIRGGFKYMWMEGPSVGRCYFAKGRSGH